jgi:hypothetical protein
MEIQLKYIHIILITLGIISFTKSAQAMQQYYFECNGCTNSQMQLKAAGKWIAGWRADAHVFNEEEKVYKKYRVYKQIMGQGEETWTNISASMTTPNQQILTAFENLVDSKRIALEAVKDVILIINSDGTFDVRNKNNYIQEKKYNETQAAQVVRSKAKEGEDDFPPGCTAPAIPSTADTSLLPIYYLTSAFGKAELFNDINNNFNQRSIGNWPKFFHDNKLFAEALAASDIPVAAQAGQLLRVFGKSADNIQVGTPDGGTMSVSLNFSNEKAVITEAFDGNCNEIPLSTPETLIIFKFSQNNSVGQLEGWLGGMGISINGSYRGLVCRVRALTCSTLPSGSIKCTRSCAVYFSTLQ